MDIGWIGGLLGLVGCSRTDIAYLAGDPVILSDVEVGKLCLLLGLGMFDHPIGAQAALQRAIDQGMTPRTALVTSKDELEELPTGTIIQDDNGTVCMMSLNSVPGCVDWDLFGTEMSLGTRHLTFPVIVLREPTDEEIQNAEEPF